LTAVGPQASGVRVCRSFENQASADIRQTLSFSPHVSLAVFSREIDGMSRFWPRLVCGLTLAVALPAPAASPTETFQCEMVVRTTTYGVVDRATLTTKGDWLRYQKRTGAGLKLLFIRNRQGTYHVNLHTNDGAKWPPSWAKDLNGRLMVTAGPQGDPQRFLNKVKARRTGRQSVNGAPAEVWAYSLPTKLGKPQAVRVFMDVKEKRPVKVEFRTQVAPSRTDLMTIEYPVYRWNFPLPDSFFNLPPGTRLVDLGNPEAERIVVPGGTKGSEKPAPVKRTSAAVGSAP
jgi:hypothetical protein